MFSKAGNWGGGDIFQYRDSYWGSNCYFCKTDTNGAGVLIDSGFDGEMLYKSLRDEGLIPTQIHLTHGHFDHVGGALFLQKMFDCSINLHIDDLDIARKSNFLLMAMGKSERINAPVLGNLKFQLSSTLPNGVMVELLHCPGHTPGSVIIRMGNAFFTGDSIYSNGISLSGLPGENSAILRDSIIRLIKKIPSDSMIYPGHGRSSLLSKILLENKDLIQFLKL